jgi:hypothetical protein
MDVLKVQHQEKAIPWLERIDSLQGGWRDIANAVTEEVHAI